MLARIGYATHALVLCCVGALAAAAHAEEYDLVINNGRVMDPETDFDAVCNVGIRNGRIAAISGRPPACRPSW